MKAFYTTLIFVNIYFAALAQVGIGIQTPDASAELEVSSTERGVLIPRISSFSDIASPATGLLVYYTGQAKFYYYNGTSWQEISPFSYRQGDNGADEDDMVMDFNNDRNLGIEAATPASRLSVSGNTTIGSGYANSNAAPANGLLVEGRVGIGVTDPGTNALEVNGDVEISGTLSSTYGSVPIGLISMWSGSPTALPNGWVLCDGATSYTDINGFTRTVPDLRGRFIVAYNSTDADYDVIGDTGGEKAVTLTTDQIPAHNHTMSDNGAHTHNISSFKSDGLDHDASGGGGEQYWRSNDGGTGTTTTAGYHGHAIYNTGGDSAHENRPPFYTLAYIIRVQ